MPPSHRLDLPLRSAMDGASFEKRETPKIGGSSGGFIALVVCLCVIIAVTCSAIFYLLRFHEPSDAERATRRAKRYQQESTNDSYPNYGTSPPLKAWTAKLGGLFGGKSGHGPGSGGGFKLGRGAQGKGWVPASSGDEWDVEPGEERRDRRVGSKELTEIPGHRDPIYSPPDPPFRPPLTVLPSSDSASSVSFDTYGVSGMRRMYDGPSPQGSLSTIPSSRMSSLASQEAPYNLTRSTSPDHIAGSSTEYSLENADRQQSGSTARTFSGGTKFIEAL